MIVPGGAGLYFQKGPILYFHSWAWENILTCGFKEYKEILEFISIFFLMAIQAYYNTDENSCGLGFESHYLVASFVTIVRLISYPRRLLSLCQLP